MNTCQRAFLISAALFACAHGAWETSDFAGFPEKPVDLLEGPALAGFQPSGAEAVLVDGEAPGRKALQVTVDEKKAKAYESQVRWVPKPAIAAGRTLVAVCRVRLSPRDMANSRAVVEFRAQKNSPDWTVHFTAPIAVEIDKNWRRIAFAFTLKQAANPGDLKVFFILGAQKQIVEIGGFSLVDFGPALSVAEARRLLEGEAKPVLKPTASPAAAPRSFPAGLIAFFPAEIPMEADEIPNPGRGFFRWNNQEIAPVPCPDRYVRYNWSVVEKEKGIYDFSVLEKEAETAKSLGGQFAFGIRGVVQGVPMAAPGYFNDEVEGWKSARKSCWVPDWNSEAFLSRHDALCAALGARFNKDPRIAYIEIRSYGNWGEWHLSGFEEPPAPMTPITEASIHRLIDAWARAFPDKQLIMMSDNDLGLAHALSLTNRTFPFGWRRDSWCNPVMEHLKKKDSWEIGQHRWKTAPVTVESYGGSGHDTASALEQLKAYHVSGIGNGNFGKAFSAFPPDEQQTLLLCAKKSGYRYLLRGLALAPTGKLAFHARWANLGLAPIYTDWAVTYRLREGKSGRIAWEGKSKGRLRDILPTLDEESGVETPVEISDSFDRPNTLAPGAYTVEIIVRDSSGYFQKPLALAMQGRTEEGAYALGAVELK